MTKPPECPSSWAVYVLLATETQRVLHFHSRPECGIPSLAFCVDMSASISARSSLIQRFKAVAGEKDSSCTQRDSFLASLDLLHAYGILTSPTIRSLAYRGIPSSWNTLISVAGERAWPFAARSSYENSSREADIEPHVASKGIVCRFDPYGEKE